MTLSEADKLLSDVLPTDPLVLPETLDSLPQVNVTSYLGPENVCLAA